MSRDGPTGGDGRGASEAPVDGRDFGHFDSFSYIPDSLPTELPEPVTPSEPHVWTYGAHMSKRRLTVLRDENNAFPWDDYGPAPVVRRDCLEGGSNAARPCPWARCRWHLATDYNRLNGSLTLNFPGVDLDQIPETCALDVADRGETSLDDVGRYLNVTREAMRLAEIRAFRKIVETSDTEVLLEWLDRLQE